LSILVNFIDFQGFFFVLRSHKIKKYQYCRE